MELKDYWRTVRRRWRVVVVCFVVTLIGAALLTWQSTPQYSSSTRLFVSTSESDTSAAYTGNLFASQRVTSYADTVTSRQLAEASAGPCPRARIPTTCASRSSHRRARDRQPRDQRDRSRPGHGARHRAGLCRRAHPADRRPRDSQGRQQRADQGHDRR
ncbi:Wzz/FepE/Etk N-terminal domain-containing protein [Nocardioides sp. B-3]|uniref:Wzz/FepE/Etk N-terminal domain-containing protein n=1 Tax=Nocardioides sp. B-3 TaxID=2895565 RepID=UPI0021521395|nr:Wzz/FepE/Etk N-terminal domain-containing protein [Nocardioides sp. B-3]UUZ57660.1 Wzz/FepE/Etk N-terminal domain-containing protein [Nocardioides sp. B-3]